MSEEYDANVETQSLKAYSRSSMYGYGRYVLENRAVPDFRDGLKPVARRVLWSSYELGLTGSKGLLKKSARIVGDTLGKYHPHGDTACYGALVGMTHLCQPTMFSSGNFGSLLMPAAAMRYTETRLTVYSDQTFFDRDLLTVTNMAPNFDGSEQEPVVLPAILPNLLLNGASGIAVGATCSIPAFEPEGVIKVTKKALRGKKITVDYALKHLVPKAPKGGEAYLIDGYEEDLRSFFATGSGAVWWVPKMEWYDDYNITISGFVPQVVGRLATAINSCEADEDIERCYNTSDIDDEGIRYDEYHVEIKKKADKDAVFDRVYNYFSGKQNLVFNLTERLPVGEDDSEVPVNFFSATITEFFQRWAEWRIELERKSIDHLKTQEEEQQKRLEERLWVVQNRGDVLAALKEAMDSDDPSTVLQKELGIDEERAKMILELRIRQLHRLEESTLQAGVDEHKAAVKQLKADHKDPTKRLHGMIDGVTYLNWTEDTSE